jgi:hypothetical protein
MGVELVRREINRALVVHCVNCYSLHVWPRSTPGPRGVTYRWDWCEDCGTEQNHEIDA